MYRYILFNSLQAASADNHWQTVGHSVRIAERYFFENVNFENKLDSKNHAIFPSMQKVYIVSHRVLDMIHDACTT